VRREATLILGGGPAGSAAAITLARAGERPPVLERQRETGDALCGGFLSWHSLALLDRLGMPKLRGATVDHVRLFTGSRSASARLPRPALGLSRRQLDSALLAHAEALGARVERGVTAREIAGREVRTSNEAFAPERLLLASGKHDVRGAARPKPTGDPALGLRVRLGPAPALRRLVEGAIELHLFDRGYAGLVLQEDGSANLCLAVRKSRLSAEGGTRELLAAIGHEVPALGERLAWLSDDAAVDAIASVPYGWRATSTAPGVYRLGDQAGVIPSLAGEGMGIALTSGVLAGQAVLAGTSAEAFQRDLAQRTLRPIMVARAILAAAERPATAPLLVRTMTFAPGLATLLARATRVGH
jgi:flavin-dependent dehydrogenase